MKMVKDQAVPRTAIAATADEIRLLHLFRKVDRSCQRNTLGLLDHVARTRPARPALQLIEGGKA